MSMKNLSVIDIVNKIKSKEISCQEITQYYLNNIIKYRDKNAVLETFDDAMDRAREIDDMVASCEPDNLPALVGVPILLKDNIMYKGHVCSSASKALENYEAQYNATVVDKLLDAGVVILGRTNMDEFAMGGSCENSAFGPCKNAHDDACVSGGSSGGSAVAVALDMCAFALGSDTGGSVRQLASFNGVVGIKPTNYRVSRYGLMAFAGSLDTVGIFTRSVEDNALVLSIIAGKSEDDATTMDEPVEDYLSKITGNIAGKKIAIIKEVQELVNKTEQVGLFQNVIEYCQKHGAIVTESVLPEYPMILPVYYTTAFAEVTTNMNRYDGVRFGNAVASEDYIEMVSKYRSDLLGCEVRRRIMLGNFVLSSEHYNSYYLNARKMAGIIKSKFLDILKDNDVIFMPTTYGEAFEIGSKTSDPVSMYIEDMFTVTANIVGLPAISVPVGTGKRGLPIGLQILSSPFNEGEIYNMADFVSRRCDHE